MCQIDKNCIFRLSKYCTWFAIWRVCQVFSFMIEPILSDFDEGRKTVRNRIQRRLNLFSPSMIISLQCMAFWGIDSQVVQEMPTKLSFNHRDSRESKKNRFTWKLLPSFPPSVGFALQLPRHQWEQRRQRRSKGGGIRFAGQRIRPADDQLAKQQWVRKFYFAYWCGRKVVRNLCGYCIFLVCTGGTQPICEHKYHETSHAD